jgi:hypothetical protein
MVRATESHAPTAVPVLRALIDGPASVPEAGSASGRSGWASMRAIWRAVFVSLHHYNVWGAVWDITGGLGGRRGAPENPIGSRSNRGGKGLGLKRIRFIT